VARSKLRRALFALACAAPLLAACNAILGISDYKEGECNGGPPCVIEAGADTGPLDGSRDALADVVVVDATGADPVSWARWVMPNYGDGGSPTVPIKSVSKLDNASDGGFRDSVSALVWREIKDNEKGAIKLDAAEKLCADADPKGAWRLPTRIELVTLLDFSLTPVTGDSTKLKLQQETYWTSSAFRTVNGVTSRNWGVKFLAGESTVLPTLDTANDSARVICIRGK